MSNSIIKSFFCSINEHESKSLVNNEHFLAIANALYLTEILQEVVLRSFTVRCEVLVRKILGLLYLRIMLCYLTNTNSGRNMEQE